LDDYRTERLNYQALADEWTHRQVKVPRDGEEYDAAENKNNQVQAYQFKMLLIECLKGKNIDFQAVLPLKSLKLEATAEEIRTARAPKF
jgi:hypothetical protein